MFGTYSNPSQLLNNYTFFFLALHHTQGVGGDIIPILQAKLAALKSLVDAKQASNYGSGKNCVSLACACDTLEVYIASFQNFTNGGKPN